MRLSNKSLIELGLLLLVDVLLYFLWGFQEVSLFSLGFIWNWSVAQDLSLIVDQKRYRFSMLKTVINLQMIFLKPFKTAPTFVRTLVKILPAGTFWALVIWFNDSTMPWWITYFGSMGFEVLQIRPPHREENRELVP